eukprot:scaffold122308_cov63-Phaeocystis_antarctica.AAC.1
MHALSCGARRGARLYRACVLHAGRGSDWASATSQSVGSVPVNSCCRSAQCDTTAYLAPGTSCSSLQEWLRKAVTSPITAGSVRSWSVSSVGCTVVFGRGSDSEEAAAVAALVGGSDTDDTLQRAMDLFRCLPAGRLSASEEVHSALERVVRVAAADERRDRRRLLRIASSPAQATQAAVDAASIAARGEGGHQKGSGAQARTCPVVVVASLGKVCDIETSGEHADTQEVQAGHGPQPLQSGAWLHGAITAAAQSWEERAGEGEIQRGKQVEDAPNPVHTTRRVALTTRMKRASVGKRARRNRQIPRGAGTSHSWALPMIASIG